MKKSFVIAAAVSTLILLAGISSASAKTLKPKMIDVKKVLTAYGFKNGNFNADADIVFEIPASKAIQYGKIEGDIDLLDTGLEFLTATYFSPIEIKDVSAKKIINAEMSTTTEAGRILTAKKLCAMWYKKRAINQGDVLCEIRNTTDYEENYLNVINDIKEVAGISDDNEIYDYYCTAIENTILVAGKKHLGGLFSEKQIKEALIKPLIKYFKDPTKENLTDIVSIGVFLVKKYPSKYYAAYIDVLSQIDDSFKSLISGQVIQELKNPTIPEYTGLE